MRGKGGEGKVKGAQEKKGRRRECEGCSGKEGEEEGR